MTYSRRSIGVTVAATAALGALAPHPATAAELPAVPALKLPSASYQVTTGDSVWVIAQRFGVSVSSIIEANGLGSAATVYPGQRLEIPTTRVPAVPASPTDAAGTYTVKRGDTLSGIALRNGTTVAAIVAANGLRDANVIYPGQKLTLRDSAMSPVPAPRPAAPAPKPATPAPATATAATGTYTVQRGDTLSGIAARNGTTVTALVAANGLRNANVIYPGQVLTLGGTSAPAPKPAAPAPKPATPAPAAPTAATGTYTVQRGDTLSGIAARNGTTVAALVSANGLRNANVIYPGQVLTLGGTSAPAPKPAAPAPKPATPAPTASTRTHTVVRGDTLSGIAAKYGTTVSAIMSASALSSTVIYPGQVLTVAGTAAPAPAPSGQQNLVPNTFLHYTYPDATVRSANENKAYLNSIAVPSRTETQAMVRQIAIQYGVDPALAQAHAFRESGFDARAVSPANAIGTMQVIPSSGKWASDLIGRDLNLLNPRDNIIAGVVIIRQLQRSASSLDEGIAAYYQGLGGVRRNGMYPDTVQYVQRVKASMAQFR
ncbi:LysM peptidoglycan-binding domain-containing protein [Flaviflexus huanghaiensis]|uniref:LysM peptidoglycan-binding domain-containing protein n=1 Tax=Flaviflexus huanghaiensis TaxID=1111473 RepID=UPI0015FC444B|nr:LysM peptidoglycan-binding domain-containing protein [Flaviflexus huanghaiensis]